MSKICNSNPYNAIYIYIKNENLILFRVKKCRNFKLTKRVLKKKKLST